jgi:hypothetical protein
MKQSICLAAKAYGVGTSPPSASPAFSSITADGTHDSPDPRLVLPKGSAEGGFALGNFFLSQPKDRIV